MEPVGGQRVPDWCIRLWCPLEDDLKRFKFNMEDGGAFNCIAQDFRTACLLFDQAGYDPRQIDSIEER